MKHHAPTRGPGSPTYGKLKTASLPSEVHRIWLTRECELDPCPSMPDDVLEDDPREREEDMQAGALLWKLAAESLTAREFQALTFRVRMDMTLDEVGLAMRVTRERARQIEQKALRKLKHPERLASVGMSRGLWNRGRPAPWERDRCRGAEWHHLPEWMDAEGVQRVYPPPKDFVGVPDAVLLAQLKQNCGGAYYFSDNDRWRGAHPSHYGVEVA